MTELTLSYPQWVGRFITEIMEKGNASIDVAVAELETWPNDADSDWQKVAPEYAALENLSYWEE